ncbi:MAG: hypothetical protein COA66_15370 [Arcobacter sp.]|nr:MAG: hypothetical protein COA66_15370 [Arcobacter sp.]
MERRNRSLKALKELKTINYLDKNEKAVHLKEWCEEYLINQSISDFDLELADLKQLSELFFVNIHFLKDFKEQIRKELIDNKKLKKFMLNS